MATNIFNYDGTLLTTVADGALDQTHASIKFPGRGYQNYGEPVLESLLWVMQNFSGTTEPSYPIKGQLWYDTTAGASILKLYDGTAWTIAGGVILSDTEPSQAANQGAFWYDTINKQLRIWNGNTESGKGWDVVGPLGSKINTDPINPSIPVNSVVDSIRVLGEDGQYHQLWRVTIGGKLLAVLSKDATFTPQSSELVNNGFAKLYPGINFNSTISGIGVAGDNTLFKSTQTNVPNIDVTYDLGTPSKRFNTLYAAGAVFSNGVGIGSPASSGINFQVSGTSKFDRTVTLGPGATNRVPIKWSAGALVTTPQNGAVEFDGNNFYFTGLLNGVPTRQTPIFNAITSNTSTFYVSTHGDDTNDGRSRTTAFRTIKHAVSQAVAGYSIFIESGEYFEQNPIRVPAYVSIVGDNLRRVYIRPVHNQLDIFHVNVNTFFFGMTFKDHRSPAFCFSFPCSLATAVLGGPSGDRIIEIVPNWSDSGYTTPPEVFIEGPGYNQGTQARATANLVNGGIVDIEVTDGGTGYSTPPIVTLTGEGGTGTGATATARVANGALIAIDITSPGSGYVSPVSVAISGGGGVNAAASATVANGVIGSYTIVDGGSGYGKVDPITGYKKMPWVSVKPVVPAVINSSPYVQNCSSITGPFDINGELITGVPLPYPLDNPGGGFAAVDPTGAGSGIRIDGQLCGDGTVIRSFVADAFTQINQGGIGHLIINRGYAQFVSCFTTFSSIGYVARSGGFANISNSVIDFGDVGIMADGYYPVEYTGGIVHQNYTSKVSSITIVNGGNSYVSDFTVTFPQGLGAGGSAAVGTAKVENGKVVAVEINGDPLTTNYGYITEDPDPVTMNGGGGTGALGLIVLEPNTEVQIDSTSAKPEAGSAMLLNSKFYTVVSAGPASTAGSWIVTVTPGIVTANVGAEVNFYEISNISTGGLALEYVGSGVTYNALPMYGGIPNADKQVADGAESGSLYYPGRVYYVTIDNTGNFKIGPFFAVNFIDGSVSLGPGASLNLTSITSIGPFKRNGEPVGTYANEISLDKSLTHLANTNYDDHTLPTQSAVRGYFGRVKSNVVALSDNLYDLGTNSLRWRTLNSANSNFTNMNTTNGNITTLTSSSGSIYAIDNNNFNSSAIFVTGANINIANVTTLNSSTLSVDAAGFSSLTTGTATVTTTLVAGSGRTNTTLAVGTNLNVGVAAQVASSLLANSITSNTSVTAASISSSGTINGTVLTGSTGFQGGYLNGTTINASGAATVNSLTSNGAISGTTVSGTVITGSTGFQGGYIHGTDINASGAAVVASLTSNGAVSSASISVSGTSSFGATTVNGELHVTGDIIGFYGSSDQRLKTNIATIPDALTKVLSIDGITFDWNDTAKEISPWRTRREAGVLAQQVEQVLPEIVHERETGYKAVDYNKLVPLLIEAIKELNARLESLENK